MKKSIALVISVLLVLTLIVPATVLASGKGGGANGRGKAARAANAPTVAADEHAAPGQAKKAAKLAAKQARTTARLGAKGLPKGLKASAESSPTTPAAKPSVEGTKSVGPGVANALRHIIINLTRKFAKVGEAVPQGLVNVWYKFSTWLGISTDTRPWVPDTVAPVITVTGVTDGGSYTAAVTPTFSAVDARDGVVTPMAKLNGAAFTSGTAVSAVGGYTLVVTAMDAASNVATTTIAFTINAPPDTVAPLITVGGVEDGGVYAAPVTPTFSAVDAFDGPVTSTATLNGAAFTSGTVVSANGAYTLVVTAMDAASNVATVTVAFNINTP